MMILFASYSGAAQAGSAPVPRGGLPRVLAQHTAPVLSAAWTRDGRRLAFGAQDGTVRLVEAATGKEVCNFLTGGPATSLAFSPDGKTLAVCQAESGRVSTWEVGTGKLMRDFGSAGNGAVEEVSITPDGQAVEGIAVGRLWNWRLNGGGSSMMSNLTGGCAGVSPDGSASGWCDDRGMLQMRRHDNRQPGWTGVFTTLQVGKARCLAFGPGGKFLAVGEANKGVQLWDVNARRKTTALAGLDGHASKLNFSTDGQTLAGLSGDGTSVVVWDVPTKAARSRIYHGGAVQTLALSPDGKLLAMTAKGDRTLLVAKTSELELTTKGMPKALSAQDLAALWDELANPDAVRAEDAWRKLGSAGDDAVPFLRKKIRPLVAPEVDLAKYERWATDLGSEKYATRERATRDLLAAGELAVAPLQQLLSNQPNPEAAKRANFVLQKLSTPVRTPERTRVLEAVALLERVGSAPAVALLKEIERDTVFASIRQEAHLALQRVVPR
jgi:hypothetical protein